MDEVSQRDIYTELVWIRVFPIDFYLVDCFAEDLVVLVWVHALLPGIHIVVSGVVAGLA